MKRIVLVSLLAACTRNGDIGISNQPVTCQPAATGVANGTVTSASTHQSYTFGSVAASLTTNPTAALAVALADPTLSLQLSFPCGSALGTYEVGAFQTACPMFVSTSVAANLQQFYANGLSGMVILDQNVGCLAGRYEIDFGYKMDNGGGAVVDEGTIAGWFSVPMQ
jgi:hypothetical protein